MERIEQILWNKTTDELTRLCAIAQIKGRSGYKDTKVQKLYEFYSIYIFFDYKKVFIFIDKSF